MGRSPKINSFQQITPCHISSCYRGLAPLFLTPPFLLAGRFFGGVHLFPKTPFLVHFCYRSFFYLIPNVVFCTFFATHTHTHNSMSKNAVAIYIIYVFGGQKRPKKTKKFKREMIRHFFSSRFFPTFRSPPPTL